MHNILVLGAGMVAKPLVEYLLDAEYNITIASNTPDRAGAIINNNPGGKSVEWEADDLITLDRLISGCDLVISLLPYRFHPEVAKICIRNKKHMVTTSYVRDEMRSLDNKAREAGILLLNEIGFDPGIDHMSAMRIIDKIHSEKGKVQEFYSVCGALPAPESADNPFKYKFSWSPRGVILASKNSADYLKKGEIRHIDSESLFKERFAHNIRDLGELEVYPNRDSISYIDIYGIPETRTMFRGTFRYRGWCEILDTMRELHLLREEEDNFDGYSYSEFISSRLTRTDGDIKQRMADSLGIATDSLPVRAYEWLGLFSESDMGYTMISPFEIIYNLMLSKMMIGEDDRDMVVLKHLFLASYPGGRTEMITSRMVDFGSVITNTSISRTVGLPAAIAAEMILKGEIKLSGVYIPVIPEIYNPVLERLDQAGISMEETFGLPESDFIK